MISFADVAILLVREYKLFRKHVHYSSSLVHLLEKKKKEKERRKNEIEKKKTTKKSTKGTRRHSDGEQAQMTSVCNGARSQLHKIRVNTEKILFFFLFQNFVKCTRFHVNSVK